MCIHTQYVLVPNKLVIKFEIYHKMLYLNIQLLINLIEMGISNKSSTSCEFYAGILYIGER